MPVPPKAYVDTAHDTHALRPKPPLNVPGPHEAQLGPPKPAKQALLAVGEGDAERDAAAERVADVVAEAVDVAVELGDAATDIEVEAEVDAVADLVVATDAVANAVAVADGSTIHEGGPPLSLLPPLQNQLPSVLFLVMVAFAPLKPGAQLTT